MPGKKKKDKIGAGSPDEHIERGASYDREVFRKGMIATLLTQPLDVMKTRMMNAPPGFYSSIMSCAVDIGKNGPLGFFKGFIPAFVRLGPHTVLTFVFFEQIRQNFGDPA